MRTFFWTTIFWFIVVGAGFAYLRMFDTTGLAQTLFPVEGGADTCAVVTTTGDVLATTGTTDIMTTKLDDVMTKLDEISKKLDTPTTSQPIASDEPVSTTETETMPGVAVTGTIDLATGTTTDKPTKKPTTTGSDE